MPRTIGHRPLHALGSHRLWLIVAAVLAFLLAALWTKPLH
jgi:hypothetical protein